MLQLTYLLTPWCYSSCRTLAALHIPLHSFLSVVLNLHLLIPIFLRSSSALSIHLVRGFPSFLISPGFPSKAFLGSLRSSVLQTCHSHLNRKVLITVAISYNAHTLISTDRCINMPTDRLHASHSIHKLSSPHNKYT
jgi:hypothetical protein